MPYPYTIAPGPITDPQRDAVRHWQSLLDARLIGTRPETPPDVAANRAATDALFRGIAHDRRRLERAAAFPVADRPPPAPVRPEPVEACPELRRRGPVTSANACNRCADKPSANGVGDHTQGLTKTPNTHRSPPTKTGRQP